MKIRKKATALLVLLVFSTLLIEKLATASDGPADSVKAPAINSPKKVTFSAAHKGAYPVYISSPGVVKPYTSVSIKSQVDGLITSTPFSDGDTVSEGQILFTIDHRIYEYNVEFAEAALQRDSATLGMAKKNLSREMSLLSKQFVSEKDTETQEALVKTSQATVYSDQANLNEAKLQLEYSTLRSPITGRIGIRKVDVGNLIHTVDGTILAEVEQVQPIKISIRLPQSLLPVVTERIKHEHVRAEIFASGESDKIETADVTAIENSIDENSGNIQVVLVSSNASSRLWPGQQISARIVFPSVEDRVAVESSAIIDGPYGPTVYVVNEHNKIEIRSVNPGQRIGAMTIVLNGVNAGERVVAHDQYALTSGMEVDPQLVSAYN